MELKLHAVPPHEELRAFENAPRRVGENVFEEEKGGARFTFEQGRLTLVRHDNLEGLVRPAHHEPIFRAQHLAQLPLHHIEAIKVRSELWVYPELAPDLDRFDVVEQALGLPTTGGASPPSPRGDGAS